MSKINDILERLIFKIDKKKEMKKIYNSMFIFFGIYVLADFILKFVLFIYFISLQDEFLHVGRFLFTSSEDLISKASMHDVLLYVSTISLAFNLKSSNVNKKTLVQVKKDRFHVFILFILLLVVLTISKVIFPAIQSSSILKNNFFITGIIFIAIGCFYSFVNLFTKYFEREAAKHLTSKKSWILAILLMLIIGWSQFTFIKIIKNENDILCLIRREQIGPNCFLKKK